MTRPLKALLTLSAALSPAALAALWVAVEMARSTHEDAERSEKRATRIEGQLWEARSALAESERERERLGRVSTSLRDHNDELVRSNRELVDAVDRLTREAVADDAVHIEDRAAVERLTRELEEALGTANHWQWLHSQVNAREDRVLAQLDTVCAERDAALRSLDAAIADAVKARTAEQVAYERKAAMERRAEAAERAHASDREVMSANAVELQRSVVRAVKLRTEGDAAIARAEAAERARAEAVAELDALRVGWAAPVGMTWELVPIEAPVDPAKAVGLRCGDRFGERVKTVSVCDLDHGHAGHWHEGDGARWSHVERRAFGADGLPCLYDVMQTAPVEPVAAPTVACTWCGEPAGDRRDQGRWVWGFGEDERLPMCKACSRLPFLTAKKIRARHAARALAPVTAPGSVECDHCEGTGEYQTSSHSPADPCAACDGVGKVPAVESVCAEARKKVAAWPAWVRSADVESEFPKLYAGIDAEPPAPTQDDRDDAAVRELLSRGPASSIQIEIAIDRTANKANVFWRARHSIDRLGCVSAGNDTWALPAAAQSAPDATPWLGVAK